MIKEIAKFNEMYKNLRDMSDTGITVQLKLELTKELHDYADEIGEMFFNKKDDEQIKFLINYVLESVEKESVDKLIIYNKKYYMQICEQINVLYKKENDIKIFSEKIPFFFNYIEKEDYKKKWDFFTENLVDYFNPKNLNEKLSVQEIIDVNSVLIKKMDGLFNNNELEDRLLKNLKEYVNEKVIRNENNNEYVSLYMYFLSLPISNLNSELEMCKEYFVKNLKKKGDIGIDVLQALSYILNIKSGVMPGCYTILDQSGIGKCNEIKKEFNYGNNCLELDMYHIYNINIQRAILKNDFSDLMFLIVKGDDDYLSGIEKILDETSQDANQKFKLEIESKRIIIPVPKGFEKNELYLNGLENFFIELGNFSSLSIGLANLFNNGQAKSMAKFTNILKECFLPIENYIEIKKDNMNVKMDKYKLKTKF